MQLRGLLSASCFGSLARIEDKYSGRYASVILYPIFNTVSGVSSHVQVLRGKVRGGAISRVISARSGHGGPLPSSEHHQSNSALSVSPQTHIFKIKNKISNFFVQISFCREVEFEVWLNVCLSQISLEKNLFFQTPRFYSSKLHIF